MSQGILFDSDGGATISPDGIYRYRLWRRIGGSGPPLALIMLNPSKADAAVNDPTMDSVVRLGANHGASRVIVGNLFGYRETDSDKVADALAAGVDVIGPENSRWLREITDAVHAAGGRVVCAWGSFGWAVPRARIVYRDLQSRGIRPWCFGVNKDESPRHPLFLARRTPLEPYTALCDHKFIDSVTCLRCGWDCRVEKARLEQMEPR